MFFKENLQLAQKVKSGPHIFPHSCPCGYMLQVSLIHASWSYEKLYRQAKSLKLPYGYHLQWSSFICRPFSSTLRVGGKWLWHLTCPVWNGKFLQQYSAPPNSSYGYFWPTCFQCLYLVTHPSAYEDYTAICFISLASHCS